MTAVEWLAEKLRKEFNFHFSDNILEEAKEMERQQIIKAHGIKTIRTIKQGMDCYEQTTGEQYYNETYNNVQQP